MRRVPVLLVAVLVLGLMAAPPASAVGLGSLGGLGGDLTSPVPGAGSEVGALTSAAGETASLALGVFASGALGGAGSALRETARVISQTTAPRLQSTWFSATYWRVAALAGLLSLPFLFAAAAQALLRADLLLLARSVFGYLPLAVIAVNLAAPITMLLLSATDEMSSVVAGAGMAGGVHFLQQTAREIVALSALDGSPFLAIALGVLTLGGAVALAVEMLIREAAVYIVVLMLPLAFAALIWPARRTWAVRLVELLVALILSKFVIVAVLSLAGAAYGSSGTPTLTRLLTAMTLVLLATFAPWVMLRLLPFTELAAGAAGAIRGEVPRMANIPKEAQRAHDAATGWAESLSHVLRGQAGEPSGEGSSANGGAGRENGSGAAAERLEAGASRAADATDAAGSADHAPSEADRAGSDGMNGAPTGPPSEARAAHDSSASDGTSTAEPDGRRGPFAAMEPMWQFEGLTPSWMSLDDEGVRRVVGPRSSLDQLTAGSEPDGARPVDPEANEREADQLP